MSHIRVQSSEQTEGVFGRTRLKVIQVEVVSLDRGQQVFQAFRLTRGRHYGTRAERQASLSLTQRCKPIRNFLPEVLLVQPIQGLQGFIQGRLHLLLIQERSWLWPYIAPARQ